MIVFRHKIGNEIKTVADIFLNKYNLQHGASLDSELFFQSVLFDFFALMIATIEDLRPGFLAELLSRPAAI